MSFSDGEPVEGVNSSTGGVWLRFRTEIVAEVLPIIAALVVGSERAARVVAAVDHAVLAAGITGNSIHHAVLVPINLLEHLMVTGVMPVGHQVTRGFPTPDVAG